jgi:hypothetical protein
MKFTFLVRRRLTQLLLVAFFSATFATSATELTILGIWRLTLQSQALYIHFRPDGTYWAKTPAGESLGKWTSVDDDHVATWANEKAPRRVNKYRLERGGTILVITDGHGRPHVHTRVFAVPDVIQ